MAHCDIIPLAKKACSGKCMGGVCGTKSKVWVLAACEGMAALFQKISDGHLVPILTHGSNISAFADGLSGRLIDASEHGDFSQLVLVGSANDLSWTQASLPLAVSKKVIAEIQYPLISSWFSIPSSADRLTHALENVL